MWGHRIGWLPHKNNGSDGSVVSVLVHGSDGSVVSLLDLLITHERFESSSDPSINGHLHYPNDLDRSLKEVVTDKIRQYHTD